MINDTVVDALPYIDTEYDEPGMKDMVQAMIEEEKKHYRPTKNYLEHLPPLELHKFETEVLQKEFERLAQRLPMETLGMKRYELPPPPSGKLTDLAAWKECIDNSHAQLEHQFTRICNLELMQEYSSESWKSYLHVLTAMVTQTQKQINDLKKNILEINWERKQNQMSAGEQLKRLENSWVGLVSKNYEIERACNELEATIHVLKQQQEYREQNTQPISNGEPTQNISHDGDNNMDCDDNQTQNKQLPDETPEDEYANRRTGEDEQEDNNDDVIGPQPHYPDANKVSNDPEREEDEGVELEQGN